MASQYDGTVRINTDLDTSGLRSGLDGINGTVNGVLSKLKGIGRIIGTVFAVRKIVQFSQACIELGSDLEEVQNVVDVTFGRMSSAINDFASNAAEQFGLSELSAKQYSSTIGAMFKSMGIGANIDTSQITKFMSPEMAENFSATGDAVTDMSVAITQLSADMASFYNLDTDVAFQKIRAGISGETEPLKQLGINMSAANLEAFRLSQGLTTSYNAMSQSEKTLLRYQYLLSVTKDAQGDFARTSDSWANQTRILNLQLESLKANIGQGLINLFTPLLQVINRVISAVAKLAASFKAFTELITGKKGTSSTSSGVSDLADSYSDAAASANDYADATKKAADATKKAAKAANDYASPLDRIHTYQTASTGSSGGTGGSGSSKSATPAAASSGLANVDYGQLAEGETVVDKLAEKMKALYDLIIAKTEPARKALMNLWDNGLKRLGGFVWDSLKGFYEHFLVPVGNWVLGEGIPRLVNALNDGLMKINFSKITAGLNRIWDALAPFAINVGEGLLWFWEKVLVPLGMWTANEVVPRFLDTVASAIKILNGVINALKPVFQWFWDKMLQPIATWTGGIFVKVWDGINSALEKFASWCQKYPGVIQNITIVVASFFAAWKIGQLVNNIGTLISAISGLAGAVQAIGAGFITTILANPWILAIAAIIAAIALIAFNWEDIGKALKKIWEGIKSTAATIWGGIKSLLGKVWNGIKSTAGTVFNGVKSVIGTAWSGIKTATSTVWSGIKSSLSSTWSGLRSLATTSFNGIRSALTSAWNTAKTQTTSVWNSIGASVNSVFSGIAAGANYLGTAIPHAFKTAFGGLRRIVTAPINALIAAINGMIAGVVSGMNALISALNHFSFKIPDWVPKFGGSRFGLNIPHITRYPQIPYLASGAVIPPNAPFAAVLGDQRNGTNLEAPESLIRKIVREESGGNGKYEFVAQINRRTLFDEVINEAKMRQIANGRNPFALA